MKHGARYLAHVYNITFIAKIDETQLPKAKTDILCLHVHNLQRKLSAALQNEPL